MANTKTTHGRQQAGVAILFSGHLRRSCVLAPVLHHVEVCHRSFLRCDVFVHTWAELEPRTPHWRRGWPRRNVTGPEFDSRACVARLKQAVLGRGASLSMLVEQQPEVPLDSALAPDGLPFNASGMLHWGAARHFGWRMNVRGMAQAARLRRSSRKTHVLSLRVRPDDIWRFGTRDQVASLWGCMSRVAKALLAGTRVRERVGVRWQGGSEVGVRSSWSILAIGLHSCSHINAGLTVVGNDNCFFGTPRVLERIYSRFVPSRYRDVYVGMSKARLPHDRPELQLTVAAGLERVPLGLPCTSSAYK